VILPQWKKQLTLCPIVRVCPNFAVNVRNARWWTNVIAVEISVDGGMKFSPWCTINPFFFRLDSELDAALATAAGIKNYSPLTRLQDKVGDFNTRLRQYGGF
jgi:hypothetical protein